MRMWIVIQQSSVNRWAKIISRQTCINDSWVNRDNIPGIIGSSEIIVSVGDNTVACVIMISNKIIFFKKKK